MLGYIELTEGGGKPRFAREVRLGGTFLVLRLGHATHPRRIERAAARMRESGIRTAVFPAQFPHAALFRRCGIFPADPLPLRRALCPAYVRSRLDAMGRTPDKAVIAISADHMSDASAAITRTLALTYRYVLLSTRCGGEAFARALRQQHGISLLLDPSRERLEKADALILFSPRGDLSARNPILCTLYPGGISPPLLLSSELSAAFDSRCSREQMVAALHSMGILSCSQLLREISC